jgi:hypothetical protein
MFPHINGNSQWENSNHNFYRKVSFLINPHYLFRGGEFYVRQDDLVNRYELFVSQMTTDMFRLSLKQSGPFTINDP